MRVLASDIGGTSARFGLFDLETMGRRPVLERCYPSGGFAGLVPAVQRFLDDMEEAGVGPVPSRASFGVAGPVVKGEAEVSNLHWDLSKSEVAERLGIRDVRLINDFLAIGHGIPWLDDGDWAELQPGEPDPDGTIGLIGPGTGLGCAYILRRGGAWDVHPSEGGHVDFAPRDDLESDLLAYLRARFPRVSRERVVSGPGLLNVYRFLVDSGWGPEDPTVREAVASGDPSRAISERAMEDAHPVSAKALEIFISALGSIAGDLALMLKATGGVYLAGGISPQILPALRGGALLNAFRAKGRRSEIVEAAPVRVIMDPGVGLVGAAAAASPGPALAGR